MMTKYSLSAAGFLFAILLAGCGTANTVTVAYQPLGGFKAWDFGSPAGSGFATYHVYMLRGIANTDKEPQSFTFRTTKISTINKGKVVTLPTVPPKFFLPGDFIKHVPAQETASIAFGEGVMFIVEGPG